MQSTLYFSALLALLALVSFRGSSPERTIVWVIFLADTADNFYHRIYGLSGFIHLDYTHLAIDGIAFAIVLWTALGANRFWPLPVCSLHLIGLTGHLSVMAGIPGMNQIYWAMLTIPDYIQMPIILIGILMHDRRIQRIGPYRDWRKDWRVPSFLRHPETARAAA